MPIVWTSKPPSKPMRSDIGVIALRPGERVLARLLGPAWWVECHWTGRRSVICTGAETCVHHCDVLNQKGFVAAQTFNRNWRGVTAGTFLSILCITPEIGEDVAASQIGSLCTVSRRMGAANAPLCFDLDPRQPADPPPEGFDPRPFVLRAMKVKLRPVAGPRLAQ